MDASRLLGRVLTLEAQYAGLSACDFPKAWKEAVQGNMMFLMAASWAMYTPGIIDYVKVAAGVRNAEATLVTISQKFPRKFTARWRSGHSMPTTAQ